MEIQSNTPIKTFKKFMFMLMLSLIMMFSMTSIAFAAVDDDIATITEYVKENGVTGSVKKYMKEFSDSQYSDVAGKHIMEVDGKRYYFEDEKAIERAAKAVNKEKNRNNRVDELDGTIDELVNPDTNTATTILSGFSGIINTFLGIMIVLITLFMTVFTALDICYIVFPAVRGWLDNSYQSGGANAKRNADGSFSMRFVTDEAQYAVKQFDMGASGSGGANPMVIYFKKRVFNYLILSIMLFILLTGNITLLTNLAIKVVSGLLEVLTSI